MKCGESNDLNMMDGVIFSSVNVLFLDLAYFLSPWCLAEMFFASVGNVQGHRSVLPVITREDPAASGFPSMVFKLPLPFNKRAITYVSETVTANATDLPPFIDVFKNTFNFEVKK